MKIATSLLTLTLACGSSLVSAAELAKVGDTVITTETYANALKALGQQGQMVAANPDLRKRFLDHVINSQLLAVHARKEGFDKDPKFQARLADVTQQLLAGEYMDRQLDKQLTEDAVKKYFEAHKAEFSKKEIRASHILMDNEAEAKKVLAEVQKAGANFDAIAKKHSKDKTVDLGYFPRGRMVPEFDKAAFTVPKGSIHPQLVHTTFGWHIIKVVDIKGDDNVALAAVKDEAKSRARQAMQEEMVRDLREKSKIVINDQQLKDFKMP